MVPAITSTGSPQPSSAAATEPADVPTTTSAVARVEAGLGLERGQRAEQPGEAEHAAAAEHQSRGAARLSRHVTSASSRRLRRRRRRPPARCRPVGWPATSSASDVPEPASANVGDVGHGVAVGVDPEEHPAVVGGQRRSTAPGPRSAAGSGTSRSSARRRRTAAAAGPGTLVTATSYIRRVSPCAARAPSECRVGGAKPLSPTSASAPTGPGCSGAPPSRTAPGRAGAAGRARRPAGRRAARRPGCARVQPLIGVGAVHADRHERAHASSPAPSVSPRAEQPAAAARR